MSYEHKDGTGTLFKNTKKEGNQPDYRGGCCIDGQQYDLAAWLKEGKNGKFMSISIKPPYQGQSGQSKAQSDDWGSSFDDALPDDSGIPF